MNQISFISGQELSLDHFDNNPILELRNKKTLKYFPQLEIENKIEELLSINNFVYITASPLAGKTRIVYEWLKKTDINNILILNQHTDLNKNFDIPKFEKDTIVVIDDLTKLYNKFEIENNIDSLNKLISNIIKNNIKIITSSRNKNNFKELLNSGRVKNEIKNKLIENRINIPLLSNKKASLLNKFYENSNPKLFTKNKIESIGQYTLAVGYNKYVFNNLKKIINNNKKKYPDLSESFLICIVRIIYYLTMCNKCIQDSINLEELKGYIFSNYEKNKLTPKKSVGYTPFQSFFSEQTNFEKKDWKTLIWQQAINFFSEQIKPSIIIEIKDKIFFDSAIIEELYQNIHIEKQYINENPFTVINNLFNKEEQQELSFWNPSISWNLYNYNLNFIEYNQAIELHNKSKELSIKETKYSLNSILQKISTYQDAIKFFNQNCKEHFDQSQLQILIKKTKNADELADILKLYEEKKLNAEFIDFEYLFQKYKSWQEQNKLLELVVKNPGYKEKVSNLIKKIKLNDNFQQVYKLIEKFEIKLSKQDIIKLISKINRWRDVKDAIKVVSQEIELQDIKFLKNQISIFLKNSPDWNESLEIKNYAKEKNLVLNGDDYQHILRNSPTEVEALQLNKEVVKQNIKINQDFYNQLISKTKDYQTCILILEQINKSGNKPNFTTFYFLFHKARGKQLFELYQKLIDHNISPNYSIFRYIITHSYNYKWALNWLYEMIAWNINPTEDILEYILKLSKKDDQSLPMDIQRMIENPKSIINPLKPKNNNQNIFISYAHKNEQNKNELSQRLELQSINTFYDLKSETYKETLSKFWRRISRGKWIICLIDEPYLKSPFCQIELFRAITNPYINRSIIIINNLQKNIEINIEFINTQKSYWQERKEELIKKVEEKNNLVNIKRELFLIEQFYPKIANTINFIKNKQFTAIDDNFERLAEFIKKNSKDRIKNKNRFIKSEKNKRYE